MKKLKRFSALILACVMLCGLLPATALATGVSYQGAGTETDPYLISTQEQLAGMTTGNSYKLINDIKLVKWQPISAEFAGTFNGNGYTISNLSKPLFMTVLPAGTAAVTIKNVNLITADIFSGTATVFAARGNGNSVAQITVDNVHATINGKVTTSGLVGECGENRVKINNCSVVVSGTGSIVEDSVGSTSFAGGIIKHMRANTTIENTYVYIQSGGKIAANLTKADGTHVGAGGIAAAMPFAAKSSTHIKNCYVINEGTIQSSKADGTPVQGAGGLLGISYSDSAAGDNRSIANSYVYDSGTIQSVDGAGLKVDNRQGCIYGYHSGANGVPSVSGAYFYSTSTAPAIGAANDTVAPTGGTAGRTLEEMKDATNLPLLKINGAGSQWKSATDRAPAGNHATTLQGLPYLLMENNAQFTPASLTYYKGGVDVTTTVTGGGALQSITKDGVTVAPENYTFTGGALTIKNTYLEPLTVGKIVLKLTFAEGQPDRELEIDIVQRTVIDDAKQLIESGTYTFTQAAANTEADVKTALATQINALSGMSATGVTVVAENIAVTEFVAAVAGTAATPSGTNGSFKFTVALSAGGSSGTTTAKAGTITATPYVPATQEKFALTFNVTNSKTAYRADETITAEIYLAYPGSTHIGSFDVILGFDTTYLTLAGLTTDVAGVSVNPTTGKVAIATLGDVSNPGFAIAAAGTKLATATFKVRNDFAAGSTANLTFTESHVGEPNGTLLPDAITATPTTVNVVKQYTVTLEETNATITVTAGATDGVITGTDITFTVAPATGCTDPTVTYTVDGADKGALTAAGGTYTISAADVTGNVVIKATCEIIATVTMPDFGVAPTGKKFVKVEGNPGTGYSIGRATLYCSATGVYVGFVADTYDAITAKAALTITSTPATAVDAYGDIDGLYGVLPNDARIVHTYYNGYGTFVLTSEMQYLKMDYNKSGKVDAADVLAMINAYLGL